MVSDNKVVVVVIDALGVDTLKNYMNWTGRVPKVDFLNKMGLDNIVKGAEFIQSKRGFAARIMQMSKTASSVRGHREMIGKNYRLEDSLFDKGVPQDFLDDVAIALMQKGLKNPLRPDRKIGFIFNKMCGGKEAIELNYGKHKETGFLIAYTSKCDRLLQIAGDTKFYDSEILAEVVKITFELLKKHNLSMERVISRPYIDNGKERKRINGERYDKVIPIDQRTLIDILQDKEVPVFGIGKIPSLIAPVNWAGAIHPVKRSHMTDNVFIRHLESAGKGSNAGCLQGLHNVLAKGSGFYFVNLVDTDSDYGHTCKEIVNGELVCNGAIDELERIDNSLEYIFNTSIGEGDVLVVTADHGMEWNEKTQYGYHSIEPLPLLAIRKGGGNLKFMSPKTLASVGYVVADEFDCCEKFEKMCRARNLINRHDDLFIK